MPAKEQWKPHCQKILDAFKSDKNAAPFLEPVPWKEYGLYDYPQIVKNAMDFAQVQKKMNGSKYSAPKDFAADMRLVFSNCMLYNQEGSDYYVLADRFAKQFEKKFTKVQAASDAGDAIKPPTFPEKSKFSEALYEVDPDVLGQIVTMLDEKCEASLDKSTADEVEISIDLIDPKTFREVDKFLKQSIANSKQGAKKGRAAPGGATGSQAKRAKLG